MYNWSDFNAVFHSKADFNPDQKHVEAVHKHRKEVDGVLFFDRIWQSVGLKQPAKSYPPKSNAELRNLWSKVVKTTVQEELKLALLYYIIKDCRKSKLEKEFAKKTHMPEKYRLLVTGLWELDHGEFSRALDSLTDPSLTPTFTDEILYTLLKHEKCENSMAMAYYITVRPPLQQQQTLSAYYALLIKTNVGEAFYFARQNPQHKQLFEDLVCSVHEEQHGDPRAERAIELLSLPFTDEEETLFEACLLYGRASKCSGAKDSVLMRRFAHGKPLNSDSTLDRLKGAKIDNVNWEDIRNAMAG